MADVPKADVIVTNPTHYAVALQYDENKMSAPKVVAKGQGLVALRIRELGTENRVPILEAPPLARALYRHAEIGQQIPVSALCGGCRSAGVGMAVETLAFVRRTTTR